MNMGMYETEVLPKKTSGGIIVKICYMWSH